MPLCELYQCASVSGKSPDPKSFIGIMFLSLSCFPPGGVYKTIMISYSKMHAYTHTSITQLQKSNNCVTPLSMSGRVLLSS